jgi:ribonuclease HI
MAFRVFIISSWSIVYPLTLCPDISLKISRLREGLGVATNNVAEYRGLILGLKYAIRLGFKRIKVYGDSQLVCYQVHAYKLVLSE